MTIKKILLMINFLIPGMMYGCQSDLDQYGKMDGSCTHCRDKMFEKIPGIQADVASSKQKIEALESSMNDLHGKVDLVHVQLAAIIQHFSITVPKNPLTKAKQSKSTATVSTIAQLTAKIGASSALSATAATSTSNASKGGSVNADKNDAAK